MAGKDIEDGYQRVDLWGEWAGNLIGQYIKANGGNLWDDDHVVTEIAVMRYWGLGIAEWRSLSVIEKDIYCRLWRLALRKENFLAAYRHYQASTVK